MQIFILKHSKNRSEESKEENLGSYDKLNHAIDQLKINFKLLIDNESSLCYATLDLSNGTAIVDCSSVIHYLEIIKVNI